LSSWLLLTPALLGWVCTYLVVIWELSPSVV
jgi:hypothetical protein